MKINANIFLLSLIALLVVLLSLEKWSNRKNDIIKEVTHEYITDTTWINKYYELKKKYDKKTPPLTITKWLKPKAPKDVIIEKIPDSIIILIESLNKKITISDEYIKNFPKADKLIDFSLSRDSLDINTLNIEGDINKLKYPLFLDNYSYQWYNNKLHNSKYKKHNKRKSLDFSQLYINTTYDYFNKYNTLGIDYHLILGRFRLKLDYNMILQTEPNQFRFDMGVGYKLLK